MAAADMLLHPEVETFQDSLERLCDYLLDLGMEYAISCPVDDPTTAHVTADTFYTSALRYLSESGLSYFIHHDCLWGLCAVVYVRPDYS